MTKRVLKLTLEIHKESNYTKILDDLQSTLAILKHKDGEINAFEIRDNIMGGRRLRSG